jgi:hypothetical protein
MNLKKKKEKWTADRAMKRVTFKNGLCFDCLNPTKPLNYYTTQKKR